MRHPDRALNQIRPISLTRNYTKYAEGSVLITLGNTIVLCNATLESGVPRFLSGRNQGWITAEYGMLPRSTHTRNAREAAKGKQSGRTLEIQRLIGRSLRTAVDLTLMGEYTLTVDCDVIQADGGTRTAAISGAAIAVHDALTHLVHEKKLPKHPMKYLIAAVSVGIVNDVLLCDLEYTEDSAAALDMNVVMTEDHRLIEIQGTAEKEPFSTEELTSLLSLAKTGITKMLECQHNSLMT